MCLLNRDVMEVLQYCDYFNEILKLLDNRKFLIEIDDDILKYFMYCSTKTTYNAYFKEEHTIPYLP